MTSRSSTSRARSPSSTAGRSATTSARARPTTSTCPGPHRGVWNLAALRASKEIILCEALIDALTFWCAGFRHVTTSYGVNGFTDEILEAFKAYGTERVLIAYDRDEAGDSAAGELAERLAARGHRLLPGALPPAAWTPTSTRCKVTPAAQVPRAAPEDGRVDGGTDQAARHSRRSAGAEES